MTSSNNDGIVNSIIQMSPPVAVSGITMFGISMHDWVYVATLIYTVVGIATLIKKHWLSDADTKETVKKE